MRPKAKQIAPVLFLILFAHDLTAAGPYVNGEFRGRIAYSADGNHNDPDDWAASPLALAIIAEAGHKDRLVHFDYNCILPQTNPEWEKIHEGSVLGAVKHYGYDVSKFHDCQRAVDAATASIARAIDASSADDPLYFIVAGPMEVPFRGIEKSNPEKRKFVYCISHSRWNDGFAAAYKFTHTKRSVIPSGINWVQIADQNRLLSLSPYGKPGPPESFAAYHWMRDSRNEPVRFLWERMLVSTRPDPSDAGMAYFLVTGDEQADPEKLRRLIDEKIVPTPVAARKRVRLEAENFRELSGFEIEDRSDRTASHRLAVKSVDANSASMKTAYNEPYAPASGRFDVEIRYQSDDGEIPLALKINEDNRFSFSNPFKDEQGWRIQKTPAVALSLGDTITVECRGTPVKIDYVQLTLAQTEP
jgi:hypothetical protein